MAEHVEKEQQDIKPDAVVKIYGAIGNDVAELAKRTMQTRTHEVKIVTGEGANSHTRRTRFSRL